MRVSVSVDKSQYLQGETLHATVTKEVVGPERCVTPAGESLSVWDNQNHGASVDRSQCAGSCVFSPNQPSTASIDLALTADRFPPGPYMVMHTWGEAASAMLHITVVGA